MMTELESLEPEPAISRFPIKILPGIMIYCYVLNERSCLKLSNEKIFLQIFNQVKKVNPQENVQV